MQPQTRGGEGTAFNEFTSLEGYRYGNTDNIIDYLIIAIIHTMRGHIGYNRKEIKKKRQKHI